MKPRWSKVASDITHNKIRSILVISSIMVGLFAVGMILTIYLVLLSDIRTSYLATNAANIQVASEGFSQNFVKRVRNLEGVADAYGAWTGDMRLYTGDGKLIALNVKAMEDAEKIDMDRVTLVEGKYPPGEREIVIEKNRFPELHLQIGDEVLVKVPSGKERPFRIVGVVHDQSIGVASGGGGFFIAPIQGYIHYDSLEWMDIQPRFNHLYVKIRGDGENLQAIEQVANRISREFDNNELITYSNALLKSSAHPNSTYLNAIGGILVLLGFLVVFLSAFLITNTLGALLKQQTTQIGVMKTVGATRVQILFIYVVLILVYSALALAIAIPTGYGVGYALLIFLAEKLNLVLQPPHFLPLVFVVQVVIALVVPLVAAYPPIQEGIKVSIVEALSGVGKDKGDGKNLAMRFLSRLKGLSRPTMISLRNTFRKRGRLLLTLITLTLGGAIFIATLNVRTSIDAYVDRLRNYFIADINLTFNQPYRMEKVSRDVLTVPGVAAVEGWGGARVELVREDGAAGDAVMLLAPPSGTTLLEPIVLEGRWLVGEDQKAIVLSELFLEKYPNMKVGDRIELRVNGKDTDWTVVGFFQFAGKAAGLFAYTNFDQLARVTNNLGRTNVYRVVADSQNLSFDQQEALGREIEQKLQSRNYRVADVKPGLELQKQTSDGLNILTSFMLIMAALMAVVGSIGLTGTMSLNVMERVKEIGIMRAIGASDKAITRMVIQEGVIIGFLAWVFSVIASIPISRVMSNIFTTELFGTTTGFTYSILGPVVWFALVLVLSVIASVMPARNAARLTIREVLSYE